jgi:hypothetical protein
MGTEGSFPGGKVRAGREADCPLPSSAEDKKERGYTSSPPKRPLWHTAGHLYCDCVTRDAQRMAARRSAGMFFVTLHQRFALESFGATRTTTTAESRHVSSVVDEKLIELVRMHGVLYELSDENYKKLVSVKSVERNSF